MKTEKNLSRWRVSVFRRGIRLVQPGRAQCGRGLGVQPDVHPPGLRPVHALVGQGELAAEFGVVLRIAELDDASMRLLLRNLLDDQEGSVDLLFGVLRRSPTVLGLARTPLMLTMIAYLFSRGLFGESG